MSHDPKERLVRAERILWATRGQQEGAFPLRCLLSDTRMEEARLQGWPLIRVYDITGRVVGAGAGIKVMLSPQTGQDMLEPVYISAYTPDGEIEKIPETTLHVATLFECDDDTYVSLYRLDFPNGMFLLIEVNDLMLRTGRYIVAFEGPFLTDAFVSN